MQMQPYSVLLRSTLLQSIALYSAPLQGPSTSYQVIRNDTFRTFPNEPLFFERVHEAQLIRVLNSFVHTYCNQGVGGARALFVLFCLFVCLFFCLFFCLFVRSFVRSCVRLMILSFL
jgi:hypothetical protein